MYNFGCICKLVDLFSIFKTLEILIYEKLMNILLIFAELAQLVEH